MFIKKIGALTLKNFSFKVRSWELKNFKSLDIFDILGNNLIVEYRQNNIYRVIKPKILKNNDYNFISDLSRFFFDSLNFQRIFFPLLRFLKFFISITWFLLFLFLKIKIINFNYFNKNYIFYSLIGNFTDLKNILFFKKFLNNLGSNFFLSNFFFYNFKVEDINYLSKNSFYQTAKLKEFFFL